MNHPNVLMGIGAVVLCAALSTAAYTHITRVHAIDFYASALGTHNVHEHVLYNGTEYSVISGSIQNASALDTATTFHVLRTAYAKAQARRSPIYALPGSDIHAMRDGVQALQQTQQELALIQPTKFARNLVARYLYPTHSLHAAINAEDARRTLLQSGEARDAELYADAIRAAAIATNIDATRFLHAYQRVVVPNAPTYVTEQSKVTRESAIATYTKMRTRASTSMERALSNRACLYGNTTHCNAADLQLPSVERGARADMQRVQNERIDSLYSQIVSLDANDSNRFKRKPAPRIVLNESRCLNPETVPLLDIRAEPKSSGILEAHDIRMLTTKDFTEVPFFEYFANNGIAYIQVSPLRHYTCMSLEVDIGRVYAVDSVVSFAQQTPLSTYDENLRALENKLAQQYVYEYDARSYTALGLELIARGSVPADIADDIIDLTLQLKHHSAGMEFLLNGIAATEQGNLVLWKRNVPVNLESEHLFFSRSAHTSLMFLGNSSFGSSFRPFEYAIAPKSTTPYVYASDLIAQGVSIPTLASNIYNYYVFHEEE